MTSSPSTAFETALSLQHAGRFAEAETIWRQLITRVGEDPELLHHLGESCLFQKHLDPAIQAFRRSLALTPTSVTACALSYALGSAGRSAEALEVLIPAQKADPGNAQVWLYTGNAYTGLKNFEAALEAFQRAIQLAPNMFQAHFNAGNMLVRMNRAAEAEPFYRRALQINPKHVGALNNLGNILMSADKPEMAIPLFEQTIKIAPNFPKAYFNLGHAKARTDHTEDAIPLYREAIKRDPNYVRAWDKLGVALHSNDQVEEAIDAFNHALALQPDLASARFGIATCLQIQGDFEAAHREIRKAIALAPNLAFYWNALVMTKTFREGDPDIAAIEELAQHAEELHGDDKPRVFFMLGKIYSDLNRSKDAFAAWKRGNALMREQISYDAEKDISTMDWITRACTPEFLTQHRGMGVDSELPVFILGMPRSGSSLVEQIIASHSDVYGAGELTTFSRLFAERICGGGTPEFNPEQFTPEALKDLGRCYAEELQKRAPQARRITDKMPGNFAYAGLIHMALPKAKIIHVYRDARDCCLSCFSKQFISGQFFTYSLTELGHFYRAYERLMAHWRRVLPPEIFMEVSYEDLVENFDTVAPKLVAFCGLEWQDACRDFYKTKRIVRTASQAQVHKPLYASSVGRWRNFEDGLSPLFHALDD